MSEKYDKWAMFRNYMYNELGITRVVDDNLHEHYDKGMFPEVTFENSPQEVKIILINDLNSEKKWIKI